MTDNINSILDEVMQVALGKNPGPNHSIVVTKTVLDFSKLSEKDAPPCKGYEKLPKSSRKSICWSKNIDLQLNSIRPETENQKN